MLKSTKPDLRALPICHRLLDLIAIIARALKQIAFGHSQQSDQPQTLHPAEPVNTFEEGSPRVRGKRSRRRTSHRRSSSRVQEIGVFDGISLSLVRDRGQEKNSKEREPIKWSAEEKGKKKQEEEPAAAKMTAVPKPQGVLSFSYNINEKSDVFIRTRKEAMRKTL